MKVLRGRSPLVHDGARAVRPWVALGTAAVLALGAAALALPGPASAQDGHQVKRGKAVYDKYCVVCHGPGGDGKGLMGVIHRAQQNGLVVSVYPRDFTAGMFKFRSTPTGSLPTQEDLLRTVTNGIPRSGMPSHHDVSLEDREAVIAYLKTFSPRWKEQKPQAAIEIPAVPSYVGTSDSIERGHELYADAGCEKCHGPKGKGYGESSNALKDNWGEKILPFDFTSGPLKGSSGPQGIYKTFMTGLDGTPMPSFEGVLDEQQGWDIVSYCLELMKGDRMVQR